MDLETLLDLMIDGYLVTIYDLNAEKDIAKDLSIDEAKEWLLENPCEVYSFEPTHYKNDYDAGITFNVELQ